jgi:hypothetical protein
MVSGFFRCSNLPDLLDILERIVVMEDLNSEKDPKEAAVSQGQA